MKSLIIFSAVLLGVASAQLPWQLPKTSSNIQPRVIGGNEAVAKQFPYQVGIDTNINGNFTWCGGSVISEEWVLTAAHCVAGNVTSLELIFGATDRLKKNQIGQTRQIVSNFDNGEVIIHSLYNAEKISNDVALVHIPQKLEFTEYIQPVKLSSNYLFNIFTNSPAVISGWGWVAESGKTAVQHLQYGYVTILDHNTCKSSYNKGLVAEGNMCLDNKQSGISSCHGDSGGPCVSTITGELIGVTSFVSVKGCAIAPSVYSRVAYYRDWIRTHTGI